MTLTYTDRVLQTLDGLLDQEIDRLKDNLSYGVMVTTLDQYTKIAGEIAGLRSAKELIEEAISICNGRDR